MSLYIIVRHLLIIKFLTLISKLYHRQKHAYVLLAKENEIIIIRKDCLKVSIREFIDFLKQKIPK